MRRLNTSARRDALVECRIGRWLLALSNKIHSKVQWTSQFSTMWRQKRHYGHHIWILDCVLLFQQLPNIAINLSWFDLLWLEQRAQMLKIMRHFRNTKKNTKREESSQSTWATKSDFTKIRIYCIVRNRCDRCFLSVFRCMFWLWSASNPLACVTFDMKKCYAIWHFIHYSFSYIIY